MRKVCIGRDCATLEDCSDFAGWEIKNELLATGNVIAVTAGKAMVVMDFKTAQIRVNEL